MSFYAVANGKQVGIFPTWYECKESINGFKKAIYKKFVTKEAAEHFLNENKVEPVIDSIEYVGIL